MGASERKAVNVRANHLVWGVAFVRLCGTTEVGGKGG